MHSASRPRDCYRPSMPERGRDHERFAPMTMHDDSPLQRYQQALRRVAWDPRAQLTGGCHQALR